MTPICHKIVPALLLSLGAGAIVLVGFRPGAARPGAEVEELRRSLLKVERQLAVDGRYSCCFTPGCAFCPLADDEGCACAANLASGNPVCHTCVGAWEAGVGDVPGVKASDVKPIQGEEAAALYRKFSESMRIKKK